MAITENLLFSWDDVELSSDLVRFQKLLSGINDRELVCVLERERRNGRNDYPVVPMLNLTYAKFIFKIKSRPDMIRELKRNPALYQVCGFDPLRGDKGIPSDDAIERFEINLVKHQDLLDEMFDNLVDIIKQKLPDFGENVAVDSKAISTYRKQDPGADFGFKDVIEVDVNGNPVKYSKYWKGYKAHALCCAKYELPIAFFVTKASISDVTQLLPLMDKIRARHKDLFDMIKSIAADRAYDDGKKKAFIYDVHKKIPLIEARRMGNAKFIPLDPQKSDTIYYTPIGEVCCKTNPFELKEEDQYTQMKYYGFEKDRNTHKFRCPAACAGIECKNKEACRSNIKGNGYGRVVRIKLEKDRRLFTPSYIHSYGFKEAYKGRTSIERLFYRLDHLYGFEEHTISGEARMRLNVTLSMITMLATAAGYIEEGKIDKIRSRFQAA
jgi:hypothetical protein